MIFSKEHIELLKKGKKTQTRRQSGIYEVGRAYSVQPGRGMKGIPDGVIIITRKRLEKRQKQSTYHLLGITPSDAKEEGGYTPIEYEQLYSSMYPNWKQRYAYDIEYVEIRHD